MHYIGMVAMRVEATPVYDPRLVVLCDRDLCIPSCSVVSIPSSCRDYTNWEHTEDRQ